MTKTLTKSALKGTEWIVEAVFNAEEFNGVPFTLENANTIAKDIKDQLEAQGATDVKIDLAGGKVTAGNQFFWLPKLPGYRKGRIKFNSKSEYAFSCPEWKDGTPSHGAIGKDDTMHADGFSIKIPNGVITYKLIAKVKGV